MSNIDPSNFIHGLAHAEAYLQRAALQAAGEFAEHVCGESQVLCPVDTTPPLPHPGYLKNSALVLDPYLEASGNIVCEIVYTAAYSVFVHEILDNIHPQGQAKFLETALWANVSKFLPYVQEAMANASGTPARP